MLINNMTINYQILEKLFDYLFFFTSFILVLRSLTLIRLNKYKNFLLVP